MFSQPGWPRFVIVLICWAISLELFVSGIIRLTEQRWLGGTLLLAASAVVTAGQWAAERFLRDERGVRTRGSAR